MLTAYFDFWGVFLGLWCLAVCVEFGLIAWPAKGKGDTSPHLEQIARESATIFRSLVGGNGRKMSHTCSRLPQVKMCAHMPVGDVNNLSDPLSPFIGVRLIFLSPRSLRQQPQPLFSRWDSIIFFGAARRGVAVMQ
jgi:hypothetical protein